MPDAQEIKQRVLRVMDSSSTGCRIGYPSTSRFPGRAPSHTLLFAVYDSPLWDESINQTLANIDPSLYARVHSDSTSLSTFTVAVYKIPADYSWLQVGVVSTVYMGLLYCYQACILYIYRHATDWMLSLIR